MASKKGVRTSGPTRACDREGRAYQQTQAWYAEAYGKSLPTIKRWWKAGYPLDDPDAMGEYISDRGRKADEDEESSPPARDPDEIAADRVIRFGASFLDGEGLSAGIRRLQVAEKEAADRYAEAVVTPDTKAAQNRLAEWMQILDALRKIEKDNPDILKDNAKTLPIEEVEEAATKLLMMIVERARMIPLRGMQSLVGLNALEIREDLEAEVERFLDPIRRCEWVPAEYRAGLGIQVEAVVPDSGTVVKAAPKKTPRTARRAVPTGKKRKK